MALYTISFKKHFLLSGQQVSPLQMQSFLSLELEAVVLFYLEIIFVLYWMITDGRIFAARIANYSIEFMLRLELFRNKAKEISTYV